MGGLVLKLAANERLFVNGALIENGNRKTEIRILSKDALVLRERLLLTPESTDSPLGRAALLAQTAVFGLIEQDVALLRLKRELPSLIAVAKSRHLAAQLSAALDHVEGAQLREAFMVLVKAARDDGAAAARPGG